VHEGLHEPELLAVALGELPERAVEDGAEPLAELAAISRVDLAAQPGERVELLAAGEPVEEAEVAGQIADAASGLDTPRRLSRPSSEARPSVGRIRSSRSLMVVLFPAPFGPR
jgi:hypothetical protein